MTGVFRWCRLRSVGWALVVIGAGAGCGRAELAPRAVDTLAAALVEAEHVASVTLPPAPTRSALATLPASFAGILPCDDCAGVRFELNLLPDRSFLMRETYLGRATANPTDDIGTWTLGPDRRTLILKGGRGQVLMTVKDDQTLRRLDRDGHEIDAALPYDLARHRRFQTLELRRRVRGMFAFTGAGPTLTDCVTGQVWPVAEAGAMSDLRAAYADARQSPGTALLVSVDGRVSTSDDRPSATFLVEGVRDSWSRRGCNSRTVGPALDATRWQLVALGGYDVDAGDADAFLEFRAGSGQFASSDGCNRVIGTYRQSGNGLTFAVGVSTRLRCPGGDPTPVSLASALDGVASWQVTEQSLALRDAQGELVARFDAAAR